jgi:hypothetical protein
MINESQTGTVWRSGSRERIWHVNIAGLGKICGLI